MVNTGSSGHWNAFTSRGHRQRHSKFRDSICLPDHFSGTLRHAYSINWKTHMWVNGRTLPYLTTLKSICRANVANQKSQDIGQFTSSITLITGHNFTFLYIFYLQSMPLYILRTLLPVYASTAESSQSFGSRRGTTYVFLGIKIRYLYPSSAYIRLCQWMNVNTKKIKMV